MYNNNNNSKLRKMENCDINKILDRENDVCKIKEILQNFEMNKKDLLIKRGIYIYGDPGGGKTTFVTNLLKEMNYDVIKYDAGDIRNKCIIDTITKHNMSDKNIMSLFNKKIQRIAIVMDEIDGMNSGDKGGINTLIKLIRPKKTKKQKLEETTMNPIICIGNYHVDKKIKELIKVCHVFELKSPNNLQMSLLMPDMEEEYKKKITDFVQGDFRKLNTIYKIYKKNESILKNELFINIFQKKIYNDDSKKITQKLITSKYNIEDHNTLMNETDRTIVGLLWHENVIDVLTKIDSEVSVPFYCDLLDNMCFADYIDRITFQKQIWQFNEMSSLIKSFKNNHLFHNTFKKKIKYNHSDVRFTKVLTKYSTEYNNSTFVQNLCQELGMDKKDMISFFFDLKKKYSDTEVFPLFENYEITKLDIHRIYRYLEKYTTENAEDIDVDVEEFEENCNCIDLPISNSISIE